MEAAFVGEMNSVKKPYCDANDVMAFLGCKENKAYKMIRNLRKELIDKGRLTKEYPQGKVPRKYFLEKCMIEE